MIGAKLSAKNKIVSNHGYYAMNVENILSFLLDVGYVFRENAS